MMKKKLVLLLCLTILLFVSSFSLTTNSISLLLNPIPNQAPYQVTPNGSDTVYFNPFAIKRIRFAMNNLINRAFVSNNLINEWSLPLFSYKGRDSSYGFLIVELGKQMGIKEAGNESWAINEISEAMLAASTLEANQGKLEKIDNQWHFNGKQITIRFVIRNDDPRRIRIGDYVSDQLEKVGFQVVKEYNSSGTSVSQVYQTDPKDYTWQLYTEGWAGGSRLPLDGNIVTQMYGPRLGYLPGGNFGLGGNETWWKYDDDLLDRKTWALFKMYPLSEEEYLDLMMKWVEYGIRESVRIFVAGYEKE